MNKQFVTYDQALALRELGFDDPCIAFYDAYNAQSFLFFKTRSKYHWLIRVINAIKGIERKSILEYSQGQLEYEEGEGTVLAPTYSQIFRWFREKYMLSGTVIPTTLNFRVDIMEYTYDIRGKYTSSVFIGDYEQSETMCLDKLIKIIRTPKPVNNEPKCCGRCISDLDTCIYDRNENEQI